jgi:hypothetical protein
MAIQLRDAQRRHVQGDKGKFGEKVVHLFLRSEYESRNSTP